jgi:hypothetical protein
MKIRAYYFIRKELGSNIVWLVSILVITALFALNQKAQAQNWDETQKIVSGDRAGGDLFGCSVAISGSYAIVGARQVFDDENGLNTNLVPHAGAAYLFEQNSSGSWIEVQKIVASDRDTLDKFGSSVAISGDYAIVGANTEDDDISGNNRLNEAGSAYIFERDINGVWLEVQKIVASDRDSLDHFGQSVAISGNYAIVGAHGEDEDANGGNTSSSAGAAYVFERNTSGSWQEVGKIVASDRSSGDLFGFSVSISGNYAVVGAYNEDEDARGRKTKNNSGSAYVFKRDGSGNWSQVVKIVSSDRADTDYFGKSVSISGEKLIIGAFSESEDASGNNSMNSAGSAYIFELNGRGEWKQAQKIVASDRDATDRFGHSVAMSNDRVIVSASRDEDDADGNNLLNSAGSAYIFEQNLNGDWFEAEKIVASDRADGDIFGHSVSISGNFSISGAYFEDEDASGINTRNIAGSAYIFERQDPCTQSTIAAEAGPDAYTYFGYSPEECASLSGSASGGTPPYTYDWNGSSGSNITVCPSVTTVYELTVMDSKGCTATDNVTVHVTDVRCRGKKILVCHDGSTLCVSEPQVASHLAHGDYLGNCVASKGQFGSMASESKFIIYPNPSNGILNLTFSEIDQIMEVAVCQINGMKVLDLGTPSANEWELNIHHLSQGLYMIRVTYKDGLIQNQKFVKY